MLVLPASFYFRFRLVCRVRPLLTFQFLLNHSFLTSILSRSNRCDAVSAHSLGPIADPSHPSRMLYCRRLLPTNLLTLLLPDIHTSKRARLGDTVYK
jgi:hypothetical protein